MKCNKCGEFVKKGFANHLYHIFRHYKWWGNDCIWDQNNNGGRIIMDIEYLLLCLIMFVALIILIMQFSWS